MPLITCPECKKEISDKATTCPSCGYPIDVNPTDKQPVTIQRTRKKWKVWQGISIVLVIVAFLMIMNGLFGGNGGLAGWGFFLLIVALAIALFAKIGAWWSTG